MNLDGAPAASPPGGVPTLAVWGEGNSARQIVGATNVYQPDHSHVQVATSAETFDAMYRFFTGHAPETTNIVAQHHVVLSGRATLFPANAGAAGTTLQVWEVDGDTGFRKHDRPEATFSIAADGAWGPFRGSSHKHYEFAILFPSSTHHFYFEPFIRSDHLIRLLTQQPGTGLDALREKSADTAGVIFIRYKELWGDQGPQNDAITINGQNVLTSGHRAARQAAQRPVRVRPQSRRSHRPQRTDTGVRRAAFHLGGGPLATRFHAARSHHPT